MFLLIKYEILVLNAKMDQQELNIYANTNTNVYLLVCII